MIHVTTEVKQMITWFKHIGNELILYLFFV